jgi:NTP pyrophosphatase (non-canonical NTP hydrolase)
MQHSRATVGCLQLDEYVALVPKIYSAHDQNRSIWDVWCHTLHHGAAVAERLRKGVPADKLLTEIADFALWLFTVVQKLSGRPGARKTPSETAAETLIRIESGCSDLIWHRYPGVCHLCYARRTKVSGSLPKGVGLLDPCDCSQQAPDCRVKNTKRLDSRGLRRFSETRRSQKPKNIDEWQSMFGAIFGASTQQLSVADVGFHILEELGEVSDAMVRMYSYTKKDFRTGEPNWRQARLEGQIADVFSWLFTLVEKLNEPKLIRPETERDHAKAKSSPTMRVMLSGTIWRRYGSDLLNSFWCPVCHSAVCSCPLIFVPETRPLKELLRKYQPIRYRKLQDKL